MERSSASRAALLELRGEREVVEEGHRFLDEKRALLAHEVLERLAAFSDAMATLRTRQGEAAQALAEAVGADGLEHLQLCAPGAEPGARPGPADRRRSFLGVTLVDSPSESGSRGTDQDVAEEDPPRSREARACGEAYGRVLAHAQELAVELGNLVRLVRAFEQTQRRVRALEKVVLPELRADEKRLEDRLEEIDQEDAIHVRLAGRDRGPGPG